MIQNINLDKAQVSAELHGYMYDAIHGKSGVYDYGSKLSYELVSNNEIRINDGLLLNNGRFMRIVGYEALAIDNGVSGSTRYDLIVAHFETDGINETHDIRVIKGTNNGSLPSPTQEDIYNGGSVYELPLYSIYINGLNISNVTKLFNIIYSIDKSIGDNDNLLINSDFRNPINQRGKTTYTGNTNKVYTVDRWCTGDADYERTVEIVSGGIKVTNPNSEYIGTFHQLFEKILPSDNYVATVKVKQIISGGGTLACDGSKGTTQIALNEGINQLFLNNATINAFIIRLAPNSSIIFEWAKLEKGLIGTDYVPRKYAEELMLCKRYFIKNYQTILDANNVTSLFFFGDTLPVMRTTPSYAISSIFNESGGTIETSNVKTVNIANGILKSIQFENAVNTQHARVVIEFDAEIY